MCFAVLSSYERLVKIAKELESGEFGIAPIRSMTRAAKPSVSLPLTCGDIPSRPAPASGGGRYYIRLEVLVSKNINKMIPSLGYLENVLTEEEKQMLEDTKNDRVIMEVILGVGDCYDILDTKMVPPIYYNADESSVQAVIDSVKPLLQAEIDDYNSDLAERNS